MSTGGPGHGLERNDWLGRVLVASDEPAWASATCTSLSSAGFSADACSPADVSSAFDRSLPDLVLLSSSAAPEQALAICGWLRARDSTPLVVVTSSARVDPVDLLTQGADLVLRSSIGEHELAARLRVLMRGRAPRPAPQAVIEFADLILECEHRRLHLDAGTLELEGKELQLMEALMVAGSRITPRRWLREILRQDDTALDGLVRRLRERLESVEGWRRIVTVRGVGFRLLERKPLEAQPQPAPIHRVIDLRGAKVDAVVQPAEAR